MTGGYRSLHVPDQRGLRAGRRLWHTEGHHVDTRVHIFPLGDQLRHVLVARLTGRFLSVCQPLGRHVAPIEHDGQLTLVVKYWWAGNRHFHHLLDYSFDFDYLRRAGAHQCNERDSDHGEDQASRAPLRLRKRTLRFHR